MPPPPLSDLWNDLPQELRDKIVSHIPAPYLFSLRSVSKHWDCLISCPRFLRFCSQNPPPNNWLLVPRWPSYSGLLAFLPDKCSWKTIPFGLPLSLHVESSTRSSLLLRTPDYSFPQRLHVYAPLLRVSKQIIKCPSLVRGTAVLLEEKQGDAFKIFAISGSPSEPSKDLAFSDCASELHTVWYDSSQGTWEKGGRFPGNVTMMSAQKRSSLVVEDRQGKQFMLVFAERERSQELFVYEREKERWGRIELPNGDLELRNWIVRCEEQSQWLHLVQVDSGKRKVWIWKVELEQLVGLIRRERGKRKDEKVKWISEVGEFDIDSTCVDDCVGFGGRIVLCNIPRFVCFNVGLRLWDETSIPRLELERTDCVSRAFVYSPTLV